MVQYACVGPFPSLDVLIKKFVVGKLSSTHLSQVQLLASSVQLCPYKISRVAPALSLANPNVSKVLRVTRGFSI